MVRLYVNENIIVLGRTDKKTRGKRENYADVVTT